MGYGWIAALAVVAVLAGAPQGAAAQGMEMTIGGMQVAANLPVEVTADRLRVDQASGAATFSGDVLVVQGDIRMTAAEVRVDYGDNPEGRRRIERLHATGGVVLASLTEAAEGREAVYTIDDGRVVMTGDVVLTQGPNVITGERLVVLLADGSAVMEGRVRTIIDTGGSAPDGSDAPDASAPEAER